MRFFDIRIARVSLFILGFVTLFGYIWHGDVFGPPYFKLFIGLGYIYFSFYLGFYLKRWYLLPLYFVFLAPVGYFLLIILNERSIDFVRTALSVLIASYIARSIYFSSPTHKLPRPARTIAGEIFRVCAVVVVFLVICIVINDVLQEIVIIVPSLTFLPAIVIITAEYLGFFAAHWTYNLFLRETRP